MALVLQLLPLLLSRVQGDPQVSLEGSPGDRVNLSCIGVSDPTRWAWAPSFPACQGLSKGRRPILWASSSGTPAVFSHFSGRLRSLDTGIKRLELVLSAGDSGTFFCKGRQENESRTVLQVLGDKADCRASGSAHGRCPRPRLDHSPHLVRPSHLAPVVKAEPLEQESKSSGRLDQEPSLHYADLDHSVLGRHRRMSTVVPGDPSTVYAVVV
ncbi:megakaryocyte and platelet inhibitory receptor G6b isoform X2 [Cricetulus griseus]|uniref:Megakaryocyte and platelet inhibitory receptor G6b isoform X2 n=1 Tax=Cricetulus griseus TaxID=10029 RepID=A0A9J7KEM7_CRIGR|nr:megakaryocyte and platelet inhibitory receptor G6b isoform X2 [Cricetulus griseus]XP_035315756.1 megakaryocyte and platelet inhibitory receptor G6b isoform X2 [Cricetulus griseus]